jgi:hypothetical protein
VSKINAGLDKFQAQTLTSGLHLFWAVLATRQEPTGASLFASPVLVSHRVYYSVSHVRMSTPSGVCLTVALRCTALSLVMRRSKSPAAWTHRICHEQVMAHLLLGAFVEHMDLSFPVFASSAGRARKTQQRTFPRRRFHVAGETFERGSKASL